MRVCRELARIEFSADSAAYSDGEAYYLYIGGVRGFSLPESLAFVSEFGASEDPERLSSYVFEHGKIICESDAIKTLGALA